MTGIGSILNIIFTVIEVVVFIRVIMSWIVQNPNQNEFTRLVNAITEPLLAPFRFILPVGRMGGLDLSPIILIFVLDFLKNFVVNLF